VECGADPVGSVLLPMPSNLEVPRCRCRLNDWWMKLSQPDTIAYHKL
jgi:hypothetical protein